MVYSGMDMGKYSDYCNKASLSGVSDIEIIHDIPPELGCRFKASTYIVAGMVYD